MPKNLINFLEGTSIISIGIGIASIAYMLWQGETYDNLTHYAVPSSFGIGMISGLASEYLKEKNSN